jgi:hypothetical protein
LPDGGDDLAAAKPEETEPHQGGNRDEPDHCIPETRGHDAIHPVETGAEHEGAVDFAGAPVFHGEAEGVTAVLSRAGSWVTMADEAIVSEADGAGVDEFVGFVGDGSVFGGGGRLKEAQDLGFHRVGGVAWVTRLELGYAEGEFFLGGDFLNGAPGGYHGNGVVGASGAEVRGCLQFRSEPGLVKGLSLAQLRNGFAHVFGFEHGGAHLPEDQLSALLADHTTLHQKRRRCRESHSGQGRENSFAANGHTLLIGGLGAVCGEFARSGFV